MPPLCRASAEFSKPTALDAELVFAVDVLDVVELAEELVVLLAPDDDDDVLEALPVAAVGVVG